MADQGAGAEGIAVIALQQIGPLAAFDPVVAGVAENGVDARAGGNEVVAEAAEGFRIADATKNGIGSIATKQQIEPAGIDDHVIAIATLDVVVAKGIGEDVIAGASKQHVVTAAPFEHVVAGIAIDGVIAFAGGETIVGGGAPQHHMLDAAVADGAIGQAGQQGGLAPGGEGVIEDGSRAANPTGFKEKGRRTEHITRQMHRRGVAHHDVAERLLLQLGEHIQAGGATEVVEAVVILQLQHLGAKHIGKARSEHAAEGLEFLGQAADPEINILEAPQGASGIDAGGIEEVLGVKIAGGGAADQGGGSGATGCIAGGPGDRGVAAVGSDEVDEGFGVFDIQPKIIPACIGLKRRVACVVEEQSSGGVEAG